MQGTGYEAVVLHREYPVTKQMRIKNKNKKKVSIIIFNKILHVIEKKKIIKTSPFFYE